MPSKQRAGRFRVLCCYAGLCRRNHVAVVVLVRYSFHRRRGAQQDIDEEAPE